MNKNYCEYCGGRYTTQPGMIEKLCTCDIENLTEQKRCQMETQVSGILADFENLLIDVMGSRKCSIGSLENYYDLHLEVERINKLYSKIQEYHAVSQNSRCCNRRN